MDTIFTETVYDYEILGSRCASWLIERRHPHSLIDRVKDEEGKPKAKYSFGSLRRVCALYGIAHANTLMNDVIHEHGKAEHSVEVAIMYNTFDNENIFYVNNINTIEGGTHLEVSAVH